jgi:pimeloyl-ACP methyl ester carboxylesterase
MVAAVAVLFVLSLTLIAACSPDGRPAPGAGSANPGAAPDTPDASGAGAGPSAPEAEGGKQSAELPRFAPVEGAGKTAPLEGAGSIASLERGNLGGVPQWICLRGVDASRPLLLWLHGGPGWTEMPFRSFQQGLEKHFVVVHWDQRGAGKSYDAAIPRASMTVEQIVSDAVSLTESLLARFGQKKIYLLGHSWGAVLGLHLAQRRPDLIHSFISVGQPVNNDLEDSLSLSYVRSQARHRQDPDAMAELSAIELPFASAADRAAQWRWLIRFGGMIWEKRELIDLVLDPSRTGAPEYAGEDWRRRAQGAAFSMDSFRSAMKTLDLFSSIPAVDVPVCFFLGIHDHQVPFEASVMYYDRLKAPSKDIVWFHESAHFPQLEEPERFERMVVDKLLGEARD